MKTYAIVTGVVKYKDKFLLLKRWPKARTYQLKWSFCSGYICEYESSEDAVLREIKEETGLKVRIVKSAKPFYFVHNGIRWVIMGFLCSSNSMKVKLCHENTDYRWASLREIKKYPLVPHLGKNLKMLGLV